jgi:hypothetical protein
MGIRIHRAMGYGLLWPKFEELTQLAWTEDGSTETLYNRFAALTDADLTVPDEVYSANWKSRDPAILEKRLLSTVFTDGARKDAVLGRSVDLFKLVGYDDTHAVIFFPNLTYAKRWYRWDDDLDYAFEQWRNAPDTVAPTEWADPETQGDPREFVTQMRYGPYPFTNMLMGPDGAHRDWDHYIRVQGNKDLLPAIPSEIRWYLTAHGILSNEGVNQLRPLLAQWWG